SLTNAGVLSQGEPFDSHSAQNRRSLYSTGFQQIQKPFGEGSAPASGRCVTLGTSRGEKSQLGQGSCTVRTPDAHYRVDPFIQWWILNISGPSRRDSRLASTALPLRLLALFRPGRPTSTTRPHSSSSVGTSLSKTGRPPRPLRLPLFPRRSLAQISRLTSPCASASRPVAGLPGWRELIS
ncbi:unnamed protein product, partial [Nesidiocoris tenuis]